MWLESLLMSIIPRSNFAKSVITLMTGTGLAQALPILLAPVLTRLYTPADFGVFAMYASICAILAVLVTGKYELAIVVPKYEGEAVNLAVVTMMLSLAVSLVLMVVVMLFGRKIVTFLNHPEVGVWLYCVPVATFVLGVYYALNFFANRRGEYKDMAVSRVVQSATGGIIQLLAGFSKFGFLGLVVGQLFGQLLSTLFLAKSLSVEAPKLLRRVSLRRMHCVARKYVGYPKFMVPGQLMNAGANELPLLLLTVFYGPVVAGFYSLAQRVMTAPMSLFANAIGDVYRQEAAEQYAGKGECRDIFISSFRRLLVFAFLPMIPVFTFGPSIFAFVFGEDWRGAGDIASIVSVLMFFQTVSLPLSNTVLLRGWLRLDTVWQLSRVLFVGVVFYMGSVLGVGFMSAIFAYVCVCSLFFMLHSFIQFQAAKGSVVA